MRRLILGLIAALATLLGVLAGPVAAVTLPSLGDEVCSVSDTPSYSGPADATAIERAWPVAAYTDPTDEAVGHQTYGNLVRFDAGTSPSITNCDAHPGLAQAALATTTTSEPLGVIDGDLPSPQPGHVAANTGSRLIGKSYGLGTVVENPGLAIQGFRGSKTPGHTINRIINRGVSPSMLRNTVANPKVVLRQGSGNYYHLSDEAAVVLRPDGQVVTAYGRADFKQHVLDILADVG